MYIYKNVRSIPSPSKLKLCTCILINNFNTNPDRHKFTPKMGINPLNGKDLCAD